MLRDHHHSFHVAARYANQTSHPVPCDTRAWSQILASILSGVSGIARKKGADLADGSDVKAANDWLAIDKPRFNGVLKSGRKGERGNVRLLDDMPRLFLVLWDTGSMTNTQRCRVWVVRPGQDRVFRAVCRRWYEQRDKGTIKSDNFQLHPPLGDDSNIIRNTCGSLSYPLLFRADWNCSRGGYELKTYDPTVLARGLCRSSGATAER